MLSEKNISKTKEYESVDAIVYGIPWEDAVTWGDYIECELRPKVIRLCSGRYLGYLQELPHDIDETMDRITDCTANLKAYAKEIYEMAAKDVDCVYLSICSDVMDYAFNPGGPVDGNDLTSHELLTLVHEFAKLGLIGMDFVEIYPQQDPNQISAHLVSTVVLYALVGNIIHEQQA